MTEPADIYIVWGRDVDVFDDRDEAIDHAYYARESDEGWFDKFEVVHPDGTSEIVDIVHQLEQRAQEEAKRWNEQSKARPHVANLNLDDRTLESFFGDTGVDEANQRMLELARLGDRLKLVIVKPGL